MASHQIELLHLLGFDNADEDEAATSHGLLTDFYREIVNGPMREYRKIRQYGSKQGQTYFAHALDGLAVIHKLRVAGVIEMDDLEERLLLAAFTIHDINKIWAWRYPSERQLKYADIATTPNIAAELQRLKFDLFFPQWEEYLEDIAMLARHHQHDTKPLGDLDVYRRKTRHDFDRLKDLGLLMQGVDNLDLSHTLGETKHKEEFLNRVNSAAHDRRWKWISHRVGENRGLLTNVIHNEVVKYLDERHNSSGQTNLVDLLYYPEGVAYLLWQREPFSWTADDTVYLAGKVAQAVAARQGDSIGEFIKAKPPGIKVDRAALEGGASYGAIMGEIRKIVDRKRYKEEWHTGYTTRLRADLEAAAVNPTTAPLAVPLLTGDNPIMPLEQALFQKGELATAYRNLLEDHLKDYLKPLKQDPWTHLYQLMGLPKERQTLYSQIDGYRRGYFLALDCTADLETLFEAILADIAVLTGEQPQAAPADGATFRDYLTNNLEIIGANTRPNFKAQLDRYIKDEHRQCSNCSSPLRTEEWMAANAPTSIGVQSFSNRLIGGSSREPKRNICGICRAQFILEKLAWISHRDKHGGDYTTFYFHLYPYSFFTSLHLDAMFFTLRSLIHEDSRSFFLQANRYFTRWDELQRKKLKGQVEVQAEQLDPEESPAGETIKGYAVKVNGVPVPNFSQVVGNTPTLPINAPGANYGQQFLFALTHALMLADFFGCRLVMSRTPVPLFGGEYLDEHELTFFVDGVPRNLRWLLPTDEYVSLEVYHKKNETEYNRRKDNLGLEPADEKGRAAYENIEGRLRAIYTLAQQLKPEMEGYEETLLELAVAAADDPFALFHYTDRAIERKVRQNKNNGKGGSKEGLAIHLSKAVMPHLVELTNTKE